MKFIETIDKVREMPWLIPQVMLRITGKNLNDEEYIKKLYKIRNGKELNLDNPTTFFEKINWLKIHDRKEIYTTMVDKYDVKKCVEDIIGKEYVIPALGVWNNVEEIDFDKLPDQFVLKCTHDCGSTIICRDKDCFDIAAAKKLLNKNLKTDYYLKFREWPYKNVKKRILCEEYVEGIVNENYKLFCFDGVVKFLYVAPYREATVDYFDADYNHLDGVRNVFHSEAETPPSKPVVFDKMKSLAEKLSSGYPHLRIDFYNDHGKIYFGEITFYQEGGFAPYYPDKWNYIFGEYLDLSSLL